MGRYITMTMLEREFVEFMPTIHKNWRLCWDFDQKDMRKAFKAGRKAGMIAAAKIADNLSADPYYKTSWCDSDVRTAIYDRDKTVASAIKAKAEEVTP
jgi:hypothetical protein